MQPDYEALARDLAASLLRVGDPVRRLTRHWPTDGAHREEQLREAIRVRLPRAFSPETGFVVAPSDQSRQIDILVTDTTKPVVSRAANSCIFVTPDAAAGLVEVKSRTSGPKAYADALKQLADSAKLCTRAWTGLFVFEEATADVDRLHRTVLSALRDVANETGVRVNCVSVGDGHFFRYWPDSAAVGGTHSGPGWHSYRMGGLAPAYFVGNLVSELSSIPYEYEVVWFPIKRGKEMVRRWFVPIDGEPQKFERRW